MKKRELISQYIDNDYYEPCTLSKFKDKEGKYRYVIAYHYHIIFFDNYKELEEFAQGEFKEETSKKLLHYIETYTIKGNEGLDII